MAIKRKSAGRTRIRNQSENKSNLNRQSPKGSSAHKTSGHSHLSRSTTDHDELRRRAEARKAKPAQVLGTSNGDPGIIRLEFPDAPHAKDQSLGEISWNEFLQEFDDTELMFLHQDTTSGGDKSNFNKFVHHRESTSGRGSSGRARTTESRPRRTNSSEETSSSALDYDENLEGDQNADEEEEDV